MKKFFLLLIFLKFSFALTYFTNYQKAFYYAKEYNKPVFVMILSSNCPHCIHFVKALKNNISLQSYIDKNFVPLLIDVAVNNNIPPQVAWDGYTPFFDVLLPNGMPYTPAIKGEVNLNILYQYLLNSKLLFQKIISSQISP